MLVRLRIRTIPPTFRRASVCVCLYGFVFALFPSLFVGEELAPPVAPTLSISTTFAKEHLSLALLAPPVASTISISTTFSKAHPLPRPAPSHLPPLSKVRCCRPKKFGRLPEGLPHYHLSLAPTLPKPHYPLAFCNANICMRRYAFASALSHENRQHPCLLMNALLVSHPCETLGVQLRASMPALEKKGEVLLHGQAEPTMVVIAPHPHHQ